MEDRELIELAAKAINAKRHEPSFKGDVAKFTAEGYSGYFNPLHFKDQPLTLASQLDIDVQFDAETETVSALWVDGRGNPGKLKDILTICYRDRVKVECAARVIVRAAAEIGKAMQEKH
ncbi:hypothetical protein ACUZXZ_16270 [Pseudomonas juntendi]|uniref:hypothetical protein n=1 Tax=Pseudomonas juntendi TaxID=2666183 RepID=UPI001F439443|nr:hypothetical protein [Pseudomonas juntendi]MCO7055120.1 hypothetical protein [Pseudomonas juntendi]UJM10792.1 hypothetical protein L1P09_15755 [Pseudomonas juntendi]